MRHSKASGRGCKRPSPTPGASRWRRACTPLRPIDIRVLRQSLGLTQAQFAARLGFSVATLRHWERGDRTPKGPALVLLNVVQREPKAALRTLAA